jgi:hypothetical protein
MTLCRPGDHDPSFASWVAEPQRSQRAWGLGSPAVNGSWQCLVLALSPTSRAGWRRSSASKPFLGSPSHLGDHNKSWGYGTTQSSPTSLLSDSGKVTGYDNPTGVLLHRTVAAGEPAPTHPRTRFRDGQSRFLLLELNLRARVVDFRLLS